MSSKTSPSAAARKEWLFLGLLLALCVALAALQYRWTGELAAAETARLSGKQRELTEDFAARFDRELSAGVNALVPSFGQLAADDLTRRIQGWSHGGGSGGTPVRPIFKRIAIGIPSGSGKVTLTGFNPGDGHPLPMEWPAEWQALRTNLEGKAQGTQPYQDRTGLLMEFPVMTAGGAGGGNDGPPRGRRPQGGGPPPSRDRGPDFDDDRGGGDGPPPEPPGDEGPPGAHPLNEQGWVILELDADELFQRWLPELTRATLNPAGLEIHQVTVRREGEVLFRSGPASGGQGQVIDLPLQYTFPLHGRMQEASGYKMWTLESSRAPDVLEKTVASSRRRNLLLATGVTALILGSGVLLVRQTRRARRLAQAQMDFVADVSHELRTPLTVIRGAAHNLKRGIVKDAAGVERYSGLILQHTDQLQEMVQQVLDFSSAGKGLLVRDLRPCDLGGILREAAAATAAECAGCKVELSFPEDLPQVLADAPKLRQAFQNLLVNAAKHGGSDGWIGLSARRESAAQVEITVTDRGPGIPPQELEEIFKPFFRGAAAREAQRRGSGLGLGLVREIVQAHGGGISVCSGPEGGASFVVRLPVAQSRDGHAGTTSSSAAAAAGSADSPGGG